MGFTLDDLTHKRPATAVTPVTDFPDDNVVKPEIAASVQATAAEPGKGTAIDTTGITGMVARNLLLISQPRKLPRWSLTRVSR